MRRSRRSLSSTIEYLSRRSGEVLPVERSQTAGCNTYSDRIQKQNTRFYHPHQKLWSLVNTRESWANITALFHGKYDLVHENIVPKRAGGVLEEQAIQTLADFLVLKGYSQSTVKNYRPAVLSFLQFFQSRDYSQVKKEEIEAFVYHQITKYKISESAENTLIDAIKAYYEHVLGNDRTVYGIQRPKRSKTLPNILRKEEVQAIIKNIGNLKHKAVMMTIY